MVSEQPPSLVTLHGFAGDPSLFESLELPIQLGLRLPGHGPDPDCHALDFDDAVARVAARLAKLARPVHLLGYSMGARLGLWLVLRHPELLTSATLIAPHPGLVTVTERRQRRGWEGDWARLIQREGVEHFAREWAKLPLFDSQERLPAEARRRQESTRRAHTAGGLVHALRVLGLADMPPAWDALEHLRLPVTWVVGEQDEKFLTLARSAIERSSLVNLRVLPNAGHNPCLETPTALGQLLLEVLGRGSAVDSSSDAS